MMAGNERDSHSRTPRGRRDDDDAGVSYEQLLREEEAELEAEAERMEAESMKAAGQLHSLLHGASPSTRATSSSAALAATLAKGAVSTPSSLGWLLPGVAAAPPATLPSVAPVASAVSSTSAASNLGAMMPGVGFNHGPPASVGVPALPATPVSALALPAAAPGAVASGLPAFPAMGVLHNGMMAMPTMGGMGGVMPMGGMGNMMSMMPMGGMVPMGAMMPMGGMMPVGGMGSMMHVGGMGTMGGMMQMPTMNSVTTAMPAFSSDTAISAASMNEQDYASAMATIKAGSAMASRDEAVSRSGVPRTDPLHLAYIPPNVEKIPGLSDRRLLGNIRLFIEKEGYGYGFIKCQALAKRFPTQDVFLHKNQLGSFTQGDNVTFTLFVNYRGKPQATDLRKPKPGEDNGD